MTGLKDASKKHDRMLEIYSRLLSGKTICKRALADEYGINPRSIQRGIDAIRDFCANRMNCHVPLVREEMEKVIKGMVGACLPQEERKKMGVLLQNETASLGAGDGGLSAPHSPNRISEGVR